MDFLIGVNPLIIMGCYFVFVFVLLTVIWCIIQRVRR